MDLNEIRNDIEKIIETLDSQKVSCLRNYEIRDDFLIFNIVNHHFK